MPKTLSVTRETVRPEAAPHAAHPETRPLIVDEISSVKLTEASRKRGNWLSRLFRTQEAPAEPAAVRLTEVIAEQAAQDAAEASSSSCLKTGVALAALGVSGMLGYGVYRQNGWQETALAPGNDTGLLPHFPAEPLFPQAQPLTAYNVINSTEAAARLRKIVCDDVLSRRVDLRANAVDKLLVAPLLEMLLASITASEFDKTVLQQQLMLMVNVLISTLNMQEHMQLYKASPTQDLTRIAERFMAYNGYAHILLYGHRFRLWATPDGTPFVTDREGRCTFIRFNQKRGTWEQVREADNQGYSAQSRQFKDRYHLYWSSLSKSSRIKNLANDYLNISDSHGFYPAIFADGRFYPVEASKRAQDEAYTSIGCGYVTHKHLITKTDYGWEFERPSVRMDKPLQYLLESQARGVKNTMQKSIGAIGEYNGISTDRMGQHWLKKDNEYFAVQLAYDVAQRCQRMNLTDYAGAVPEYKNGAMILKRADEMLFALNIDTVKNTLVRSKAFNIETAAVEYLREHALNTTAAPVDSLPEYHPGLQEGDDYSPMFIAHDQKYAVREYSTRDIRIINQHNPDHHADDIVLWNAGNTLLRVRNGEAKTAYIFVGGQKSTLPVSLETGLYQQLQQLSDKEGAENLSGAAKKFIKLDEFALPVAWYDAQKRKSYFLYNQRYLPAAFSDAADADNPTGQNCIHLFAPRDFHSQQKIVATLVIEKKSDRIEIKSREAYLAEKLQVSKAIAGLYCENRPWSNVANLREVADNLSEALATETYAVTPLRACAKKTTPPTNAHIPYSQIAQKLYPPRINEAQLELLKLSTESKTMYGRAKKAKERVAHTLHLLKNEMLPVLNQSLYFNTPAWPTIQAYMNETLAKSNDEFQSRISVLWRERLKTLSSWLQAENMFLTYGESVRLTTPEKSAGRVVFMPDDAETLYINTHKIAPDDPAQIRLVAELFHSAAQASGATSDFASLRLVNGMYMPAKDALASLIDTLKRGQLTAKQKELLLAESRRHLRNYPSWSESAQNMQAPAALAFLAKYDPGWQAQLFLNSASLFTLISLDTFHQLSQKNHTASAAAPWVKQYGALRMTGESPLFAEDAPQSITSSTTSTTRAPQPNLLDLFKEYMPAPPLLHGENRPESAPNKPQQKPPVVVEEVEEDVRSHSGVVVGEGSQEGEAVPDDLDEVDLEEVPEPEEAVEAEPEELDPWAPGPDPRGESAGVPGRGPVRGMNNPRGRLPSPLDSVPLLPIPAWPAPVPVPPVPHLPSPIDIPAGAPVPGSGDPVKEVLGLAAIAGAGVGIAVVIKELVNDTTNAQPMNATTPLALPIISVVSTTPSTTPTQPQSSATTVATTETTTPSTTPTQPQSSATTAATTESTTPSTTPTQPQSSATTANATETTTPSTTPTQPQSSATTANATETTTPSTTPTQPQSSATTANATETTTPSTTPTQPQSSATTPNVTESTTLSTTSVATQEGKIFPDPAVVEKHHIDKLVTLPLDGLLNPTPEPEVRVYVPGHGNVTVVEIPGLECLGEKTLTVAEELRLIGHALMQPITANALAWQEIYHIDILGGDCPTPQDAWWMEDRASSIDAIADTTMMFIPPLWPVVALKTLVGPAMAMTADDIEGKKVSIGDRIYLFLNAALQIMTLMRADVPTMTGAERTSLFNKPLSKNMATKTDLSALKKRFAYVRSGNIYIQVEGKEFPLITDYDENPMVRGEDDYLRLIKFNQRDQHWEFNLYADQEAMEEAKKNQNQFRTMLTDLVNEPVVEADHEDFITVKINGQPDMNGVFSGMDFIPAKRENIANDIVAMTTEQPTPEAQPRLLYHDDYGWNFERSSAKKEPYFELLLDSKADVGVSLHEKNIGKIQESDGLCYDSDGNAYIKHNYKYYRAEKVNEEGATGIVKLPDYAGARVKYANKYFTLEQAEEILFALKTEKVQDGNTAFHIESAALQYLREHALISTDTVTRNISPGVYADATNRHAALVINNEKFAVSYHVGRTLHIERTNEEEPIIELWLDRNTWYRVRDESKMPAAEYTEIGICRVARAPTGGACLKSSMESGLFKKMREEVSNKMSSNNVPPAKELTAVRQQDIAHLYGDTSGHKTYFKYAGRFFDAKIIEADNTDNPTGFPCIRVTGRSDFYRAGKNIETIVMVREGNAIKMIDEKTFIASKLNISPAEGIIFNKKIPYNDMEDIHLIEKLCNDAQMAERTYIEQPGTVVGPPSEKITENNLLNAAKKSLFPEEVVQSKEHSINVYELNAWPWPRSDFVNDAIEFVSRQVDYSHRDILSNVIESLRPDNYNHPVVEDYLIEILKKSDNSFLNDVEDSLYTRLVDAKHELVRRKVKLMSAVKLENNAHFQYTKNRNNLVFIHEQDPDNIFINIDNADIDGYDTHPEAEELTGSLINAALRSSGKASRIVDIPRKNGIFINIKDAYRHAQRATRRAMVKEKLVSDMDTVISRYFKNTPVYSGHLDKLANTAVDWRKFAYLLRYDPGFRVQVTLNSDDMLTLVTQDLHYLVSTSEQDVSMLHPWVKKYGVSRGVMDKAPDSVRYAESIINSRVELSSLASLPDEENIVGPYPNSAKVFTSKANGLYLKWNNKYHPIEFLGNSGRVVSVGTPGEIRQVYYYDPQTGRISPVQPPFARINVLNYLNDLDLFERRDPWSDFSEVLKYNEGQGKLVPTGATRVLRLQGKVTRIEFPSFNFYHPDEAPQDIYIQGHGKILQSKSTLPANMKAFFYTKKGQQIIPYRGHADDLLGGNFNPKETVQGGREVDTYMIKPFGHSPVNNFHLSRKYNKNFIQILSKNTLSTDIIDAANQLFPTGNTKLHFYICRATKRQQMLPGEPDAVAGLGGTLDTRFDANTPAGRWAFDQQVEGGAVEPDHTIKGFLPLREPRVFIRYETIQAQIDNFIEWQLRKVPYDIYYGVDISNYSSERVPPYIMASREQLRQNIEKAQTTLDSAWSKLNDAAYDNEIKNYLTPAFELNKQEEILPEVIKRLKINTSRVRAYLNEAAQTNYDNIGIISTRQTAVPEKPGTFRSAITDEDHIKSLPVAFTFPGDAFRRVFFVNDAIPVVEIEGKTIDQKALVQPHTIIHESSHVATKTYDIFYTYTDTTTSPHIAAPEESLKKLNTMLNKGNIKGTPLWLDFMPLVYKQLGYKQPLAEAEAVRLLKENDMLKANILMENADSFAIFVQGIANLKIEPRAKREATETLSYSNYQNLGMLYAATREHHVKSIV